METVNVLVLACSPKGLVLVVIQAGGTGLDDLADVELSVATLFHHFVHHLLVRHQRTDG
jgi:hypothetical protein